MKANNQQKHLSIKLRKLRKSAELTQEGLAKKARISSASISLMEAGRRMPSLRVAAKLSEALNISVDELTGYKSISSNEIDEEAQDFFRRYGDIKKLNKSNQRIVQEIVKRLAGAQDES